MRLKGHDVLKISIYLERQNSTSDALLFYMIDQIKLVESKFYKRDISVDVIMPHVKMLDSSSKDSPAFLDPKYLPFYYRLGCEIKSRDIIQIGSNLGLIGAAFMKGCKTVNNWQIIDSKKTFINIVESNLKLNGNPKVTFRYLDENPIDLDEKVELLADVAFISEPQEEKNLMKYMDFLWNRLKSNGLLVVDHFDTPVINKYFLSFCSIKNKEPILFKTRYGVGILIKQ
jgi:hypothetical protein